MARKSERIQRVMLQDVSYSRYAPVEVTPEFRSPWDGIGRGWDGVRTDSSFTYAGSGEARLVWNGVRPITDRNSYNQIFAGFDLNATPLMEQFSQRNFRPFYVSDIALSADIEMTDSVVSATPMSGRYGPGRFLTARRPLASVDRGRAMAKTSSATLAT